MAPTQASAPADIASLATAYRALTEWAAVIDRSGATRIEHSGKDALDLLNRLSTNYMLGLMSGDATGTVLTSDRGRVLAVLTVVQVRQDALLLMTGAPATTVIEWIDRFTFEEDARLKDVTDETCQVAVAGPGAAEVVRTIAGPGAAALSPGKCIAVTVAGQPATVVRTDAIGLPCWEFIAARPHGAPIMRAAQGAGAAQADGPAWDAVRIEHGVPEHGHELTEDANPLEAGLKSLVSFTKGCYVGQEVVARLDTYDKVQRVLAGLLSDAPLSPGDALLSEGREVGRVTSSALSPVLEKYVGLAYVRRSDSTPGARLESHGGPVTLATLPLV
jgi:tRNA-modifying protein YgfZ